MDRNIFNKNKAQAWGLDLMIAFIIFFMGILVFFLYSINYSSESEENFEKLMNDGNFIFDSLLSAGYPLDWNNTNLIIPGIVDNEKVNETKLNNFRLLAENDYSRTKFLFKTKYDYLFFIPLDGNIDSDNVLSVGKPGVSQKEINASNLIKITRMVLYKEKPSVAYLYIWEE